MNISACSAILAGLALAAPARAAIVDAQPGGFMVEQDVAIAAPAAKVWEALAHVGAWWDPARSYSHQPKNMSIDMKPGGQWLETLPGGGVLHMTVVFVKPRETLRLEGALGPLHAFGVAGHLTWILKEKNGATQVTQTYDVGGHAPGGLDKAAGLVDGVLAAQAARLKRYVETGKPE
ncbi:MAG: SRPBCC domain-containing protein [Caulobacteraceae bacterium]|nr:SRPBCC domain-containing protein [Caulobacteraceae bacterium]